MKAVRKQQWVNAGLVFGSVMLSFVLLESGMRWVISRQFPLMKEEIITTQDAIERSFTQNPVFKTHPFLLFQPSSIEMDAEGVVIRDRHFSFEKPENVLRVACLGGSTTMNGYPVTLQKVVERLTPERKVEVMDWGCSNWTILESTLNYVLRGHLFRPDFILVHHGINDIAPRMRKDYRADYSHYRKPFEFRGFRWWQTTMNWSWLATFVRLRLGIAASHLDMLSVTENPPENRYTSYPIPQRTATTYRECLAVLHHLAQAEGARLILAGMLCRKESNYPDYMKKVMFEHNQEFKDFAERNGYLYVDVNHHFEDHQDFFLDLTHVRELGNEKKAYLLSSAIAREENVKPAFWISDSIHDMEPISTGIDQDCPTDRAIGIHWLRLHSESDLTDIYVRVNGEEEKFLVRIDQIQTTSYEWRPNDGRVNPYFKEGPQFGNSYEFIAYQIDSSRKKIMAILGVLEPIAFQEQTY